MFWIPFIYRISLQLALTILDSLTERLNERKRYLELYCVQSTKVAFFLPPFFHISRHFFLLPAIFYISRHVFIFPAILSYFPPFFHISRHFFCAENRNSRPPIEPAWRAWAPAWAAVSAWLTTTRRQLPPPNSRLAKSRWARWAVADCCARRTCDSWSWRAWVRWSAPKHAGSSFSTIRWAEKLAPWNLKLLDGRFPAGLAKIDPLGKHFLFLALDQIYQLLDQYEFHNAG